MFNDKSKNLLCLAYGALWFVRNKLIHDGVMQTIQETIVFIKGYLVEFESVSESILHRPSP